MSGFLESNIAALRRVQPVHASWLDGPASLATARRHDGLELSDGRQRLVVGDPATVPLERRWISEALTGSTARSVAITGAGFGTTLDLVHDSHPGTTVVVEPEPGVLSAFLAARDWTDRITSGRLRVLGGGVTDTRLVTWEEIGLTAPPPLLVHPLIARRLPGLAGRARSAYARAARGTAADIKRHSMLHMDVLLALEQWASTARGGILEIGAYIGGGTVAMARGLRSTAHRVPFLSVEPGGSYLGHPDLPSGDIFGDLSAFVRSEALEDRVELVRGFSKDAPVRAHVFSRLAAARVGLLCIDADGQVLRDFTDYLPLCRAGALAVVDDYVSPLAPEKAPPTRHAVDTLVAAGILAPIGLYGWGTWFGTVAREATAEQLRALPRVA